MTLAIAIFGGPGSGSVIAQSVNALAAARKDIKLVGFLNDVLPIGASASGVPVIGSFASWSTLPQDIHFLAPLHKVNAMGARSDIVRALGIPRHRWATIIDPMSAVAPDAIIGRGCFVGPFASVGPGARLGDHTIVRAGAHIGHDCTLGDFVFIGTGAVICGFSAVHDGAYVAPSATIRDRCRIGAFAVVGLGSVVTKDVAETEVVLGSPARRQSSLRES